MPLPGPVLHRARWSVMLRLVHHLTKADDDDDSLQLGSRTGGCPWDLVVVIDGFGLEPHHARDRQVTMVVFDPVCRCVSSNSRCILASRSSMQPVSRSWLVVDERYRDGGCRRGHPKHIPIASFDIEF